MSEVSKVVPANAHSKGDRADKGLTREKNLEHSELGAGAKHSGNIMAHQPALWGQGTEFSPPELDFAIFADTGDEPIAVYNILLGCSRSAACR